MPMTGASAVQAALRKVTREADAASRVIVSKSAALVIAESKSNFSGSHAKGQPHVGGDQPNVVSGNLRRSIEASSIVRIGFATYAASVGPTAIYGRRVELGYQGSRGYPYFTPAVEKTRIPISRIAYSTWAEFLK